MRKHLSHYLRLPCLWCHTPTISSYQICQYCYKALPWLKNTCPQCGQILPQDTRPNHLCAQCQQHPPAFDYTISTWSYAHPIDQWIIRYKHQHALEYSALFCRALQKKLKHHYQKQPPWPDCLIPVPLHQRRWRDRGFNQTMIIGTQLIQTLPTPLYTHAVKRIQHTPSMQSLTRKQREQSIRGAFRCQSPPPPVVAILDDVITSGATAHTLALELKNNGAQQVDIWSCARTLSPLTHY